MKNSVHVFQFIILFMLLAVVSCGEETKTKITEKPEVLAPSQIVEIPQAKEMYDAYGKRRVPLIERYEDSINGEKDRSKEAAKPFDASRFVYYDYETIKQYMAYIEQEAKTANVEISTLRFYFSNYPDAEVFPGTKERVMHPKQNSVMLSPTYNDGSREYLFYIAQGAQGPQPAPLNDSFEEIKGLGGTKGKGTKAYASMLPEINSATVAPAYALQGGTSLTMNRGTGVPPPKNQ